MKRHTRPCPSCGGEDRFYLVTRPRNGGSPFWICNQCRHVEQADVNATPTRQPLRRLDPEQIDQAHYGYTAVAEWCTAALWTRDGAPALHYLRSRGLTDETIHQVRLGYHPDVWRDGVGTVLWHRNKDAYDGARLGGLLGPQGIPKGLLRGVITIPYLAGRKVVMLRTRKLDMQKGAKYLSPAGVSLYAGATPTLYLLDSLAALEDGAPVVLTEGELKALLPHQMGIPAVGQPGVGYLPDAFIRQLARRTVVIAYDVEARRDPFQMSPGEAWTLRAVENLTGIGIRRQIAATSTALEEIRTQTKSASTEEQVLFMTQLEALTTQIQTLRTKLDDLQRLAIRVKVLRLPRPYTTPKIDLDLFARKHGPATLSTLVAQAQDAERWYDLHHGGGYAYERGGIYNGVMVANYQARITETVYQCDGQQTTAIQRLALRTPSGRSLDCEISAEDWADDRQARLALRAGLREGTFDDNPREVLRAVRLLSNQGDAPIERTVYTCTGWEQIGNRWHFLASDGAITAEGTTPVVRAEIDPSAIGNHYTLCGPGDAAEGAAAWLSFLRGELCPQPLALILAGQAALPLLHRFSGNTARSLVWLFHQSGALKTALIRAGVMALYGPSFTAERADGASVPKWDATSVGLGMLVFYYRDMPLLIDDYKQGVIHPDQFKRFLHNYSESTGRTRGTKTQQIDRIRPARCIVFSTAEDLPSVGDYGIEARLMAMQLHPNVTRPDALADLQRAGAAGHLVAFWRQFVQALAGTLDATGADGMRERLQALIRADDRELPGHKRAAGSLRQNRVAWLVLSHWLQEAGYISAAEAQTLNAAHLEARGLLADVLVARQKESRPATIFCTVLAELIQSGEFTLEHPGMTCPRCDAPLKPTDDGWYCTGEVGEFRAQCNYHLPARNVMGFVCEDGSIGVYKQKAFKEVNRVCSDQRQPLSFSQTAILQQLEADGLLACRGNRGDFTVRRRNPSRTWEGADKGNTPKWVLALKPAALHLDEDEPTEDASVSEKKESVCKNYGSPGSPWITPALPHQDAKSKQDNYGSPMDHHGSPENFGVRSDPGDPQVIHSYGSPSIASGRAKRGGDPGDPYFLTYTSNMSLEVEGVNGSEGTTPQQRPIVLPAREDITIRVRRDLVNRARELLRQVGTPAELATELEVKTINQLQQFISMLEERRNQ